MVDVWQTLRAGGLPLAIAAASTRPTDRDLGAAARVAIAAQPDGREADALAAFLLAWRDHFRPSFDRTFSAAEAPSIVAWVAANRRDENRILKLRRIAIENLASIL